MTINTPIYEKNNDSSENLAELFGALSKAQGKIQNAIKDGTNPHFKNTYASLASVLDACREVLSEHGLSVLQTVEGSRMEMILVTWLGHSSGQWIKSKLPLLITKQDSQGVGSAITYARRYALSAIVGISQEDDDGEKSVSRKEPAKAKKEDLENLIKMIEELPSDVREKVNSFMVNNGINNLYEMNQTTYEWILSLVQKKITQLKAENGKN